MMVILIDVFRTEWEVIRLERVVDRLKQWVSSMIEAVIVLSRILGRL